MGFDSEISIDLKHFERLLELYGPKLPRTVRAGLRESVLRMVRNVTRSKMRGQYINRRTGTAIRSVTASPRTEIEGEVVRGSFGSNLAYVRALERGFRGRVQVQGHTRRLIKSATSRAAGTRARRQLQRGRKRTAFVRPHTRRVNIRARRFFRDTLREDRGRMSMRLRRALLLLARTGKVPSGAEIRSGFRG